MGKIDECLERALTRIGQLLLTRDGRSEKRICMNMHAV